MRGIVMTDAEMDAVRAARRARWLIWRKKNREYSQWSGNAPTAGKPTPTPIEVTDPPVVVVPPTEPVKPGNSNHVSPPVTVDIEITVKGILKKLKEGFPGQGNK